MGHGRRRPCHGPDPPGQGPGRQAGGRHRAGAAGDLHLGARRQGRCAARDLYLHRPQLQVLPQVLGGRTPLGGRRQGAAAPHPGGRDPGRQPGQGRRHPAGPGPRGRTDGAREEVRPGRHSARLQRQPRRAQDAGGPPQADDVPGLPWHAGHRGDRQPGRHQELWRHAARCRPCRRCSGRCEAAAPSSCRPARGTAGPAPAAAGSRYRCRRFHWRRRCAVRPGSADGRPPPPGNGPAPAAGFRGCCRAAPGARLPRGAACRWRPGRRPLRGRRSGWPARRLPRPCPCAARPGRGWRGCAPRRRGAA